MSQLLKLAVGSLLLAAGCGVATQSTPTPTATPDSRSSTVDFGRFGPFQVGMSLEEVRTANAGLLKESPTGSGCVTFNDPKSTTYMADSLELLVTPDGGGHLVGIRTPIVARTAQGIGIGSTRAEIEAAYPDFPRTETESQVGRVLLVQKPGTSDYIGFGFSGASVSATAVGSHDFAAGYELCSD